MVACGTAGKVQAPNVKHQITNDFQLPNFETGRNLWSLEIGACLGFAIWNLSFNWGVVKR
jgi:hypothetical protein